MNALIICIPFLASIPSIGVAGIWWSIPIGWLLADAVGMLYYKYCALRAT